VNAMSADCPSTAMECQVLNPLEPHLRSHTRSRWSSPTVDSTCFVAAAQSTSRSGCFDACAMLLPCFSVRMSHTCRKAP
jgi:hypothetical protein